MSTLGYIVTATLIGGVASALAAALISLAARKEWVGSLVSFAVGTMLGAAFLEILPHAFEQSTNFQGLAATVLAGICGFFLLEKLVIWRHHHHSIDEAAELPGHAEQVGGHHHHHAHDGGRSGLLILVGDSFHNFVDGVLIAAAFLESIPLGIVTSTAVIAHEIPQEVGDFVILLHSGYTRRRALLVNLASSLAMLVGGLIAYVALNGIREWLNPILAIAAASMIYIAVADLIPGLHKRHELRATALQVSLIALGVLMIWGVGLITRGR
ncbi:MAG: ZIP family metal transporter [Betaproteobacteria bacterium]|nr:ZIP family metal transporter [Betaproteobacteria bacterium]